ncbi:MAG: crossover junction endodeoxyribonuclease RuvC [Legionellales bacterium]|jgi:crossover junction endodeoxyribonuclease RuvC
MHRILGIDPGSRKTGFGIIEIIKNQPHYIASGVIKLDSDDLSQRLERIFTDLQTIIKQYQPTVVAVEEVFMSKNANSALKLGQARGAAITAVAIHQLPVAEYAARKIKQAITGYGQAEKQQVRLMVMSLLNLNKQPQIDASDALAVALCHFHSHGV